MPGDPVDLAAPPAQVLLPMPAVPAGAPFPSALWLLRHGESEGNVAALAAYRSGASHLDLAARDADVPLTARGRSQAQAVGRWLAALPEDQRPTRVLCSPYRRAVQTLQAALGAGGLAVPAHTDERLRERDLGIFDGLTGRGIHELHADESVRRRHLGKLWYRPPGGESWADVVLRVRSLLGTTLPHLAGERVLLVTHQAVVMAFRIALEGLDEESALRIDRDDPQPNCALTRYEASGAHDAASAVALAAYADTTAVDASTAPVTEEPDADVRP